MIVVVVPVFEGPDRLTSCLSMLAQQDHPDYRVVVIDDASTDEGVTAVAEAWCREHGWTFRRNAENVGAVRNIAAGIELGQPAPSDIVVLCDGDDRLAYPESLSVIQSHYDADPDCWVTYGSYVSEPHDETCPVPIPYPREVVRDRTFRQHATLFNHPLTFRRFLWDQLTEADLRHDDGSWMREVYDEVLMYPLLELAGPNHRCLTDTLYVYRTDNPLSVAKVKREAAEREAAELRSRSPKPRMFFSDGALTLGEDDRAQVVVDHAKAHGLMWVVETGTGAGWTSERVARAPEVVQVVTIDADPDVYRAALGKFADQPKVTPMFGSSPEVIRALLPTLPPAVWWLDAHRDRWWEGDPETVTPILEELFLVLSRGQPDVVLIDDARLFGTVAGYPDVGNVVEHIERIGDPLGRAWSVSVEADVIRVIPKEL